MPKARLTLRRQMVKASIKPKKEGMGLLAIGITATDTEMGKTVVTGALAAALRFRGITPGIFKPVASGCVRRQDGELISTDAEFQMKCAGYPDTLRKEVIPVVLEAALAPAEASRLEGITLQPESMIEGAKACITGHESSVLEGIGGILIVVKPILGNVNHAVLTSYYCQQHGIPVLGFLVNGWNEETAGDLEKGNLYYYEKLTGLPVLGKLPKMTEEEMNDPRKLALITEQTVELDKILELAKEMRI